MLSIIIPVYNEESILEKSIETLRQYLSRGQFSYEILVVNNGSTDATAEIGKRLMVQYPWFRFLSVPERGAGKAFALAVREARGEFLVFIDADLSSELMFLDYARDLLIHCDMLVGSKLMGHQRRSLVRIVGSQFYILLSQLFFGLTVSDYSIGAKAFRKSAILDVLPFLDSWTGYILELCLYLHLQGKRIVQIGIECDDQRASHFNLWYEAYYRYRHIFRCWRLLRDKKSWLYRSF